MNPIGIPMEDPIIHSDESPFCYDSTCGCHEDETLIGEIAAQVEAGTLTAEEDTNIVSGKGL